MVLPFDPSLHKGYYEEIIETGKNMEFITNLN